MAAVSLSAPSPLWLAALPGLLAVWLWAVTDLQRFVLFAVLATMVLPQALLTPGGTQVALADLLLLVALGAWLVATAAGASTGRLPVRNGLIIAALLFVAVNVESLAWSDRPAETVKFTIQLFEIVVIFPLVFASLPRSLDVIERGFVTFIAVTCGLALVFMAGLAPQIPGAPGKNTVGTFLAAGVVMAYALTLAERSFRFKLLLYTALAVDVIGLVATTSRGSVLGALVALVAMSFLLHRRRAITVGIVLVLGVGFVAIHGTDSRDERSIAINGSYDTRTVRAYSFRNAREKIEERPFLGSGAGTYQDFIQELELPLPDPNNMFLLTWAEIGLVGLLALLCLLWQYARLLLAVRHLPGAYSTTAVGAGCVTLSLLVHFQFDVTWTRGTSSLGFAMMGLMLAVQRLSPASADERAPDRVRSQPAIGMPASLPRRVGSSARV